MSQKHFGTDGIRGVANKTLTPELAHQVGWAVAQVAQSQGISREVFVVRDTRGSGQMLQAALTSGFLSEGWNVVDGGILPTPAASFAVRKFGFGIGAVISASHNPPQDNGIKFFGPDGKKLHGDYEIEAEQLFESTRIRSLTGVGFGTLKSGDNVTASYLEALKLICPVSATGLKIALDCANGAAFAAGPKVFETLGCTIVALGCEPNGININAEGGATKPGFIQEQTVLHNCDLGICFDGDADRCVFSDEKGRLINGDKFVAAFIKNLKVHGHGCDQAVGTVMTNGGFEDFAKNMGVELRRASVGDKYVQAEIEASGALIGGEQSGHIIIPKHGPTGDGLVTALEFLRILIESGEPASKLFDLYEPWPQLLFNLMISDPKNWTRSEAVCEVISQETARLGASGRINVRPSGTEPILRVMIESRSELERDQSAEAILDSLSEHLGAVVKSKVELTHALGS